MQGVGVTIVEKNEILALTGVRALASWWVVFFHLQPAFMTLAPALTLWLGGFAKGGDKGVDLFFVLSGFVLSLNYHDRFRRLGVELYGRFLWLRLARIYPVHLVGLAVWAALLMINLFVGHADTSGGYFSFKFLIANLLLVQSWWIPMKMSWNYPAWSISMEWLAYLCFPLLIRKVAGGRSIAFTVGWLLVLLCVTGPLVMRYGSAGPLLRISGEFLAGCLLWVLWRRLKEADAWRFNWITLPSVVTAIVLANVIGWYSIPAFGLVVLALALDDGIGARVFGCGPMVYCGKVSYSIYIMHSAIISICHVALPLSKYQDRSRPERYGVLLLYLLCIAAAGMLTYHFVEEPMRRWMRDRIGSSRRSTVVQAVLSADGIE
jgi:peptidoglycan/LPS O-acetylase OafA/YrhL